eukprot:81970-Rhodomonas_salina.1
MFKLKIVEKGNRADRRAEFPGGDGNFMGELPRERKKSRQYTAPGCMDVDDVVRCPMFKSTFRAPFVHENTFLYCSLRMSCIVPPG